MKISVELLFTILGLMFSVLSALLGFLVRIESRLKGIEVTQAERRDADTERHDRYEKEHLKTDERLSHIEREISTIRGKRT